MEDNSLFKFHWIKALHASNQQQKKYQRHALSAHPPHSTLHQHSTHPGTTTMSSTTLGLFLLLLLACINIALAQSSCTDSAGCFPPVGNLALGRTINVSSTCMENDIFCLLFVENCAVCSPEDLHSASSLSDNNNLTFWVSEIGRNVQQVVLRLDFEGPVFFQDMTVVWLSLGPLAMTLERSCDYGETWSVYRYYAIDCATSFMLEDTFVDDTVRPFNGTTPLCTTVQSGFFISDLDFSDQLMTFSTSQHVPLNDEEAECYQTITNIRIVMFDVFPEARTSSNSSFQFYGVREWIVRGSCACNGHSDTCIPRPEDPIVEGVEVYAGCMCQHNTALPVCDVCLSGFNNVPFLPGTAEEANICESCICNGHAVDCQLDSTSSTTCINCTDNTAGNRCSECVPGFYQDTSLLLNDPSICIACQCFPAGIMDVGPCDSLGQCSCKSNVVSPQCTECQDGYFNLSASNPSGCQLCDCNPSGSLLNDQGLPQCNGISGDCICRNRVEGEQCNLCQPGSYDISAGCPTCECDFGGSTSPICDQDSPNGQCPCKPNIRGTLCNIPVPGYYFETLDSFIFEAEDIPFVPMDYILLPVDDTYGAFTGRGFIFLPPTSSAVFTISPPRDSQYELILRFSTRIMATFSASFTISSLDPTHIGLNCSSISPPSNDTISYATELSFNQFNQGYYVIDSVCLSSFYQYQLSFSYSSNSASQLLLDSFLLFPDISATSGFFAASAGQPMEDLILSCLPRSADSDIVSRIECEGISFTLITEFLGNDPLLACDCDPQGTVDINNTCTTFGGGCGPCQSGVTGPRCNTCLNGFFGFSSNGCEDCACDSVGSTSPICTDSGQCPCKPGVGGLTCSDCLQDYFNFTSEGCTPCACSEFSTSVSCDVTTGQCPCPDRVTGRTCSECTSDSFNLTSQGCQPCDCDSVGSASGCNVTTGQCGCTGVLVGPRCDQCPDGFFNTGGENRDVCARCICSGRSDVCSLNSMEASLLALQYDFTQLCSNDSVGCSEGWRVVTMDGTLVSFGPNDPNGLSYFISFNMNPMIFVADAYLGNNLGSYGLNFSVSIMIVSTAAIKPNDIIIRLQSSESTRTLVGYPYIEATLNELDGTRLLTLTISLVESNWYYEDNARRNSSLLEYLSFLSNITSISFTAEYTEDFIEFIYIREVTLLSSSSTFDPMPQTTMISTYPVEDCSCPPLYQGSSCESCARGHARPTGNIADPCIVCECNDQTLDCNPDTTVCLNCGGNTTGDNCERCQDGFYGDPTLGVPCLPCECPLAGNSFSPTCFLDVSDGLSTCDSCMERYMGRNCEICMDGFFGNPLSGGRCIDCECNGNVDPSLGPVCDMTDGRCMNCQNNTEGFECDLCQLGFFGDPSTNIPCESCRCDERGTVRYCDPLFGTCTCLPNVMGEFCDACISEFFNITRDIGCIECSCDPLGSTDLNCNQDSGDCPCLPNVGSVQDNKCRMCTPGYFNFTENIGCEACGCSELAVSDACDAVTGRCECQDGAIGPKCDDCAFGFTGQVPNCEPCHECYFQWSDIIGNFTARVNSLKLSIDWLIITYYNGYTEEALSGEISMLVSQLARVNETLTSISLEESDVEELGTILGELNSTLATFTMQLTDIQLDLDRVDEILQIVEAFDGTTNMSDVMELNSRLVAVNTTATALSALANTSLAQLEIDRQTILSVWNEIAGLNLDAEDISMNLTQGVATADSIWLLIDDANATYMQLRNNLTRLDVRANQLTAQLVLVRERIDTTITGINMANTSFMSLSEEVRRRQVDVMNLFSLLRDLNNSVELVEIAAQEARSSAENLMNAARLTVNEANSTLQNITATLSRVVNITTNLTEAIGIAQNTSSISLPSLEYVQNLADRILNNIIPEDVVIGIVNDARSSKERAHRALELAQNASLAVMSASDLIIAIQSDITCTDTTQIQGEELILIVQGMIYRAQANIEQVFSLISQLELVSVDATTMYNTTSDMIEEATALGLTSRAAATDLLNQATGNATEAEGYRNEFGQAQSDLEDLTRDVNDAASDAMTVFTDAQILDNEVRALEAEATILSIQNITNLLRDYEAEFVLTRNLQGEIDDLTLELQGLIETFNIASQTFQRCYQSDTP